MRRAKETQAAELMLCGVAFIILSALIAAAAI
jgi:hypothetical protein